MTSGSEPVPWGALRAELEGLLEASPEARSSRLAELRRDDPAHAAELEELLRADAVASSALDDGAEALLRGESTSDFGGGADASGLASFGGGRLGVWQLGERIGQGGMGTVYAARRVDGAFEQEAAVKVLRRGVDSPELRARFLLERQLLATLAHPSIVRLLDGGVGDDGLLWFALERVEGRPVTEWARERDLDVPQRLRLFLAICDAVEAAHRRLIVHRDLKPSNILVTVDGAPKLLDFGIAKVLEEEGGSLTRTEARLMTPQYAAPEQILGEAPTTGVDVYALGVVLYELLTGELPHRRSTSSPVALAREIPRESVAPASRRVLARGAEGKRLARELAGDLDAILLKALRAEPEERYRSVGELAADLRAHLEGRPVGARGGAWSYRARRLVARHRVAATAASLVLASLVAGIVGTTWQARIARAERDRARTEAEKARQVAGFMTRLFQQADPARARGANLTAREVLAAGAAQVEQDLAAQPEIQAALEIAIGAVDRDLGLYAEATPLLERALERREKLFGAESLETAEALHELGTLDRYLNRLEEGEGRLRRALAVREAQLGADHFEVARTLSALGTVQRSAGALAEARASFERALAIADAQGVRGNETGRWRNNLGLVVMDLGEFEAAERVLRGSIEELERSGGSDNPLLALPLDNLGMLLRMEERMAEALPLLERARDLVERTWGPDHLQYGTALNSLGILMHDLDRCRDAIPLLRRSAEVYGRALGPGHRYVAWPLVNEGDCWLELGEPRRALELFERSAAIRLAAVGPSHLDLALSLGRIGQAEEALGRLAPAEEHYRRALAMLRETMEEGSPPTAEAMVDLATLLERRGDREEAASLYAEALPIFRATYPQGHSYVTRVETSLHRLRGAGAGAKSGG